MALTYINHLKQFPLLSLEPLKALPNQSGGNDQPMELGLNFNPTNQPTLRLCAQAQK
jgi:hypothetical protein